MAKHGTASEDYYLDFRTGSTSAIRGSEISESIRAACSALNRRRTRAIREASQENASGESLSADAWSVAFERRLNEWELPLVPLEKLGIFIDRDGYIESKELQPLQSGAEASPYQDLQNEVVYKLFDLKENGALGKKIVLEQDEQGEYQIELRDADLYHTMTKLSVLNDIGGHPTEIVGIAETGDYLIAKQPLAFPMADFEEDRKVAVERMRAIVPSQCHFRQMAALVWSDSDAWMVADLHKRNIMRDSLGKPTVIDALIGSIPPAAVQKSGLNQPIRDAQTYRLTGKKPTYDLFDGFSDDEL